MIALEHRRGASASACALYAGVDNAARRGMPRSVGKPLAVFAAWALAGPLWASTDECSKKAEPATAEEPALQFNLNVLKKRGIDPKAADFFSRKSRFTPGLRRIQLLVNGVPRGTLDAMFDAEGQLCFSRALMVQGGLQIPPAPAESLEMASDTDNTCYPFLEAFAQTEITLRPELEEVALVVSAQALRPVQENLGVYQRGGTAGLLNYQLLQLQNQSAGRTSRYTSANTELGFNAGDWLVRSRQMFSVQNGVRRAQTLYTYAQKTFVQHKTMLQVGEINIANSVFPGTAITGLQLMPDSALQGKTARGATVEGIAQSQARVEIRQNGALIHTTLVPAGPFRLPNVPVLNAHTDLEVQVIETQGEAHRFSVSAASLASFSVAVPGHSLAVGQVRTFGTQTLPAPTVVTGTAGWALSPRHSLSVGLLGSDQQYQAGAFSWDTALLERTSLSLRGTVANAGQLGQQGLEGTLGLSTRLTPALSASVSTAQRSSGFRDMLATTRGHSGGSREASRQQYGASLRWNHPLLGSFASGYSTSSAAGHDRKHLTGSWSKSFEHFSLNANLERSVGTGARPRGEHTLIGRRRTDESNALSLSLSVPLGSGRNLRSYARQRDGVNRYGSAFSDSSDEFASYQLAVDSRPDETGQDLSGSVSLVPRYTSMNLGYAHYGADSRSYSGQLSGGLLLHGDGVTLTPYPLRDSFAVAQVGEGAGVKLNTPSGPVWTDLWGRAVVSQLNAYQTSSIEVATDTLPRNVDLNNGFKAVSAGRGSVHKLDFAVITTRRVLLQVRDGNGTLLNKGTGVFSGDDQYLTSVIDNGKVFLSNAVPNERLTVRLENGQRCRLKYTLPDKADPNVYFESSEATCIPL